MNSLVKYCQIGFVGRNEQKYKYYYFLCFSFSGTQYIPERINQISTTWLR